MAVHPVRYLRTDRRRVGDGDIKVTFCAGNQLVTVTSWAAEVFLICKGLRGINL